MVKTINVTKMCISCCSEHTDSQCRIRPLLCPCNLSTTRHGRNISALENSYVLKFKINEKNHVLSIPPAQTFFDLYFLESYSMSDGCSCLNQKLNWSFRLFGSEKWKHTFKLLPSPSLPCPALIMVFPASQFRKQKKWGEF